MIFATSVFLWVVEFAAYIIFRRHAHDIFLGFKDFGKVIYKSIKT